MWTKPRLGLAALRHMWSSEVNAAAVELLDPRPGEHVLDLGSGLGPAVTPLARRVGPTGRVTAVDPSAVMRAVLRARLLGHANRPAVRSRAGMGERLPLPEATVDAVLSLNAMHHLESLEGTAAELARVLRPGGRIVLADEDFGHAGHSFQRSGWLHDHGPDMVEPDHLASVLAAAGLVDVTASHGTLGNEPACVVTATKPAAA